MKLTKLIFAALLSSVFMVSCDSDDDPINLPLGAYQGGFFILNEGNASAGSVTFSTYNYSLLKQDIFGAENGGDGVGGYVQSIFFDADKAYIIASGSNKITVVNRYTFKAIGTIEIGLYNPRYGVVRNGKAYVTNQADFMDLTDDYLAVINLSNNTLGSPIPVGAIAEKIFEENGKLYVLNGTYGNGNTIKVINPTNGTVDATITLPQSPNSFETEDGKLYVLTGNYDDPSHLVRINLTNHMIESDITFPIGMVNAQNLNEDNDKLYFTIGNKIYSHPIGATTVSSTELLTTAAQTLYGFRVNDGYFYVTDAKDYVSDGALLVYGLGGSLTKTLTTGLIPNSVYFN